MVNPTVHSILHVLVNRLIKSLNPPPRASHPVIPRVSWLNQLAERLQVHISVYPVSMLNIQR